MKKTACKFCGKEYGQFKAVRYGETVNIRKWVCDNFKCRTHNPYDPVKDHDSYRIYACKLMNQYPEKINVLKKCGCEGKRKIKHHPNYNKPFEVELLCYGCHWKAHEKIEPGFNSNDKNGWFSQAIAIKASQKNHQYL